MKTFVDLSWIRGKAKCVLIDEIKHVADENNFTLKCESFNQFENANFIYFDTEKKEISDEHFKGVCGSEITLNNALQGKYEPNTTRKDSVEFNGKKYKYVYNEYSTNFSALDCIRCDFRKNNPKDICADILNKIGMNSCKSNFYFKECSPILQNAMNRKYKFHVGQRVQFKSWEEMVNQYGLNIMGSIKIKFSFIKEMKYLCGTYATIEGFYNEGNRCYLNNFSKNTTSNRRFNFTTDMLKPASTKEL